MDTIVFLHLFCVGLWFGCIGVEIVIELLGLSSPAAGQHASKIHFYTDFFIELPAILTVLVTGFLLFDFNKLSLIYGIKLACGLIAILANLACVFFVVKRKWAVDDQNQQAEKHYNKLIFLSFTAAPFGLVAFYIGLQLLGIIS